MSAVVITVGGLLRLSESLTWPAADGAAGMRQRRLAATFLGGALIRMASPPTQANTAPRPPRVPAAIDLTATTGGMAERQFAALPVNGRVAGLFGDRLADGTHRKGLFIRTDPGAVVAAPAAGRVVFAGHFRDQGPLLIIDHGEGYHTLMLGFARVDSTIGRAVRAGEVVGVLAREASAPPALVFEVWRNNQPVDPLPWLGLTEVKESG